MSIPVCFTYLTGLPQNIFSGAQLVGSWDEAGRYSDNWRRQRMNATEGPDGCPSFTATVDLDPAIPEEEFHWGVSLDGPSGSEKWAIMTEVMRTDSAERIRTFRVVPAANGTVQEQVYCLQQSSRMGAQKYFRVPGTTPGIRFRTWEPNAKSVDVCMATLWQEGRDPAISTLVNPDVFAGRAVESSLRLTICGGYIADESIASRCSGEHPKWGPFRMSYEGGGFWATDPNDPGLANFEVFDHAPYMFRITKDDGSVAFRTDLYSRCQIGYGTSKPKGAFFDRTVTLDGKMSCSVVIDPGMVATDFAERDWPETNWTPQEQFFRSPAPHPSLTRFELRDLIIYELHVGALGVAKHPSDQPGTLADAIALLDHIEKLGVNAVELLPLSEFGGSAAGWGYSTSHYHAIEYSGGGRDQYKHFIRECHRRGIAVIMDVVYNHYSDEAARAQWMRDTDSHERNSYYWYEGLPGDYPNFDAAVEAERRGQGGYVNNLSSGWAPRYWEEPVRDLFVSSALALASEFEIDGMRVDQTTSIRSYNALNADGRTIGNANDFGSKLLRELTRSLRFIRPRIKLMAEDHANWDGVISDLDQGGLGFDAIWYADFYHHLIGDTDKGCDYAKLIKTAGMGGNEPLAMDYFAGALQATKGGHKVVYHESHDEAGNGKLTDRTIRVAVNGAPLIGETRRYAEARCRFAAGVTLLSAGVPMFLFGEEVGAEKKFLYNHVLENREDMEGMREGSGKKLFAFYADLIRFRRNHAGLRSPDIDVIFVHNEHRLLMFRRWGAGEEFLVLASLNNQAFDNPHYEFRSDGIPAGEWIEIFNSDSGKYGGDNIGNYGATIEAQPGFLACIAPANSVVVFQRNG